MHKVLASETSCDETSVSIVSSSGDIYKIHSNIVASQIEDHSQLFRVAFSARKIR